MDVDNEIHEAIAKMHANTARTFYETCQTAGFSQQEAWILTLVRVFGQAHSGPAKSS